MLLLRRVVDEGVRWYFLVGVGGGREDRREGSWVFRRDGRNCSASQICGRTGQVRREG